MTDPMASKVALVTGESSGIGKATASEARQNLASLLEKAAKEGEVRIRRKDGQIFVIKPQPPEDSPLDVESVDLGITTPEILQAIQEGRRTF